MRFSDIHSSVILQRNQLIFSMQMSTNVITFHSKFQLNHAKFFQDMSLRKLAEFLRFFSFCLFFFFLSNNKNCHKMQMHYPIVLKFSTQQESVSVHRGFKFGCNTINDHKVKNNYSRKIAPTMLSRLQG